MINYNFMQVINMPDRDMINRIKKLRESIYQAEEYTNKPSKIEVVSIYDMDFMDLFANNSLSIAINEKEKEE